MTSGHQVPWTDRSAETAPTQGVPGPPPPEPSPAERARTVVVGALRGTLATLGPRGYPFASVVNLVVDESGRPLTYLSTLAPHTQYALADPRASILVAEDVPAGADPLAAGRVTLVGDLNAVPEAPRMRERFLRRHPAAAYIDYGDFACYRLEVRTVRWVGGFGRMDWIPVPDYAAAGPDPLWDIARGAIAHMNADHGPALVACCRAYGGPPDTSHAVMTGLDRYGFDVIAEAESGQRLLRIAFDAPLADATQLRPAMIELTRRARAASG